MAKDIVHRAAAIVGVGAVLPDAPDVASFWDNLRSGRYSISETPRDRWDPALFYDPDPQVPDKTYTKIGAWVREYEWDPLAWRVPIPPTVADAMDLTQKWAIVACRQALLDYGWPDRLADPERTAVILGNAMGGDKHYRTAFRALLPEYVDVLSNAPAFSALPAATRAAIIDELQAGAGDLLPPITEDTMPGELGNITAGRIANVFDFRGPNFIADAACASTMAAMKAAVDGLVEHDYDVVLTGGIDANMGPTAFIKFCKIGALSATGSRPYGEGADGFVMGEGAAVFVLKRVDDAERDGDRIYAVIRGFGASSDGKGKGITAPNPIGQMLAVRRAWANTGLDLATVGLVEGHGTSTRVGDVAEMAAMNEVFGELDLPVGKIPLGSVKSNIGHLKAAAGAASMLKATLAVHDGLLPPSLGFDRPNPDIDFSSSSLAVNTELREWEPDGAGIRRAGVSAFGFGGTNFHAIIEQHVPGRLTDPKTYSTVLTTESGTPAQPDAKPPLRGALVLGAGSDDELASRVEEAAQRARAGDAPAPTPPAESDLRAPVRLAVDYGDAEELAERLDKALVALKSGDSGMWRALGRRGVFYGRGAAPKTAFLFTGQGSQYVNMLRDLAESEPIVAETFAEADEVMTPLLGRSLTDYVFIDTDDEEAFARTENDLLQTEITQPAVLTADEALSRLLAAYGVLPDMVMGHSLGEYGALVAAGALPFADALTAVSARGRGMAQLQVPDNGKMVAVLGPLEEIQRIVDQTDGYVVVANINSTGQAVIGGASDAVDAAVAAFGEAGIRAVPLSVSHAFHTAIVSPASEPLAAVLRPLGLRPPELPLVANITGEFYPSGPGVEAEMVDILAAQVASPVQFVKGLETLWEEGVRLFVEVGPKRALTGFAEDVLGGREGAKVLFTNQPKLGGVTSFNRALCGFYAAGLGVGTVTRPSPFPVQEPAGEGVPFASAAPAAPPLPSPPSMPPAVPAAQAATALPSAAEASAGDDTLLELGRIFARALQEGARVAGLAAPLPAGRIGPVEVGEPDEPIVISGTGLGLPGGERVFDDANIRRILAGEMLVGSIPDRLREGMAGKSVVRLIKSESGASFESVDSVDDVVKVAGRPGALDLVTEYHFPEERVAALDMATQMAIAGGLDALRDAGIPLVMSYKTTTTGSRMPDRWMLPEGMRAETGVVFASAFPGLDALVDELNRFHRDRSLKDRIGDLETLRDRTTDPELIEEIDGRIRALTADRQGEQYTFDRHFIFRVLSMGHSQFAEYIGAQGPNTQVNSACASTALAVATAEDWIRSGRCRRVVIISADFVTGDQLIEWFGAAFMAVGAVATDEAVEDAVVPFDRRRHGMVMGTGSAALVVESAGAGRERGVVPIAEVLSTAVGNSAFHGTRLDIDHIRFVMEQVVADAESRWGIDRHQIAPQTVFVSHETYTPARGGSAQAEVDALRYVFGGSVDDIVVANTKGYTGHAMGAGVEEVVAVKILETGIVPPVRLKEPDPDLGYLNLSRGGTYDVEYALRLAAGFGSQIALSLLRRIPPPGGVRPGPDGLGYAYRIADAAAYKEWLQRVTGLDSVDQELAGRTLRVVDTGPPARPAMVARRPAPPRSVVPAPPAVEKPEPVAAAKPQPSAAPAGEPVVAAPVVPVEVDEVAAAVLRVVAEQTGYPPEMLELDLDLEADLGIDTVKQAETFAAIREVYGIERDDSLALRDFPTLQHVIGFVYDHRPDLRPSAAQPVQPASVPAAVSEEPPAPVVPVEVDEVAAAVLRVVAEQTGYPPEMLELDLDLEADLGIDTVKQAETFAAIREVYGIERDDSLALRDFPTLQHVIGFVYDHRPDLRPSAAPAGEPVVPVEVDEVAAAVLRVVAEQTGYPPEMLELDLDLEADLGIDTVKQAETFAAIREVYGIERDDSLALRDFPTLQHVIGFVYDHRPDLRPSAAPAGEPVVAAPVVPVGGEAAVVEGSPEAVELFRRRVPRPVLRPGLDRCVATGVALDADSRVVVMADRAGIGVALAKRLRRRGVDVLLIEDRPEAADLADRLESWAGDGPVTGVYWLPAADIAGNPYEMDITEWHEHLRARVRLLFTTVKTLYHRIGESGSFLVSATRLGGRHGYGGDGAADPVGGAVAGFTKTFSRERPAALVKVVDLPVDRKTAAHAEALIAETLADPGVIEVGLADGRRFSVALVEEPAEDAGAGLELGPESVFVVTGAAGSITSAITADLAAASSGGVFHLIDLTPEPDRSDPDLARFATDRDGLKRDIFERIKASGKRATPALVERELARLERLHAAATAIEAIEAAGGTAYYHSADLRDPQAIDEALAGVRSDQGRIDVLLHAGGLEISRLLSDKAADEFDLVFDVKADGWFNLMRAIGEMPVAATVAFSSIAGRFGNRGQADYSAANDLLCKLAHAMPATRPGTRAIAVDWTAWADIGMATRGSIPRMMEEAGIDMLPSAVGIPFIRRELVAGGGSGEVVVAGALGVLEEPLHASGGFDVEGLGGVEPMAGKVAGWGVDGLEVVTTLDPAVQGFLNDHRVDGTALLPAVMGVEGFAEAAAIGFPDLAVTAVEEVEFVAPFKFYRDEPRQVTIVVRFEEDAGEVVAHCRLIGSRTIAAAPDPVVTTHHTARVRLGSSPDDRTVKVGRSEPAAAVEADDVYAVYFHGPAYQVLAGAGIADGKVVGRMAEGLPDNHAPAGAPTRMRPRLIELVFQTAGIWEIGTERRMGLPTRVGRIVVRPRAAEPAGGIKALVTPSAGGFAAVVVDASGHVLVEVEGYETVTVPGLLPENGVSPIAAAVSN